MIYSRRPGFTILETTISVGIMALLAGLVIVYSNRGFETDLNTATSEVAQVLRDAREKTLASVDDTTWSVSLSNSAYSLECAKGNCADESSYDLPAGLEFTDTYDVSFIRLTGFAGSSETIEIRQISNPSNSKNIYVTQTGSIGSEPVATPPLSWVNPTARLVKVISGPTAGVNDTITVQLINEAFAVVASEDIQINEDNIESGYFVYSETTTIGEYSVPISLVIEIGSSPAYYVYFDSTQFNGYGLRVSNSSNVVTIEPDGDVYEPSSGAYELF